ncbi:hypothetical protein AX14_013253 [Amanita brunnescens Koide BX004]|nr:hypothetical protein AX14_013253 [Amanita brunnescens Koide BX004]
MSIGRILLAIASLTVLHAAFSTYEHFSHLKALGTLEGRLPRDIVWEALLSLFLGIMGASLSTPELKEITWASEMKKRKIDDMDSRMGIASYVTRGRNVLTRPPKTQQRTK